MPDWDQWDAEALEAFVPWFTNDNFLQHLFHPHNEHRVILTKLQNLALVLLNGQWDSRLEAVTNAVLHAALAAGFWLLGLRLLTPARPSLSLSLSVSLFALAFALFGLPLAWQNVLGGFHSQQYWLVGLSFVAIVTLPFRRPFSAVWWVGAVSGFLALGSMGSGFLAAVAVVLVVVFQLSRRETTARAAAPTLVVSALLILLGLLTRHEVPWHAEMKARTVHDFVFSIVHSLQWPWRDHDWAALVLWLPWLLLATQVLSAKPAPTAHSPEPKTRNPVLKTQNPVPQAVLALGGWVLLQLAATAYARGAGADYPASRYMDTLTFGAMANALALACLLTAPSSAFPRFPLSRFPAFPLFLSLLWLLTLGFGLHRLLAHTVRWELDVAKKYYVNAESNLRRYLATNDPRHLAGPDVPFPSVEGLIERLAIPSLRATMPVPIRAPLNIQPASASSGFSANNAIRADLENPPRAGLSPTTPPLDYTITWGSHDANSPASTPPLVWRSAPLTPTPFPWLRFETAGQLGLPHADVSLALHDAATDRPLAPIRPSRVPGDSWRSAYVRMPEQPFIIVATDHSPANWLAFSPPVEMGRLSYWAWQATKHAGMIFWLTLSATGLLLVSAVKARRRPNITADVASEWPPPAS